MTDKRLSEEVKHRVTSIKTTKARSEVLSTIAYSYGQDITAKYSDKINLAKKTLYDYKVPDQRSDVEAIVAVIKKVVGKKYDLRHEVVCKIASGNDLTFVLDFNRNTVSTLASAEKEFDTLADSQKADEKRLAAWKRKQLINIANGLDFEEFKP